MTQYNIVNVKLSNSRFNKLISATNKLNWNNPKILTDATLADSANSNDETNFTHKLSLTDRQVLNHLAKNLTI